MKKVLFLLLLVTSISYGQALFDKGIKIPNNVTSTTATKVNVQESNGLINTIAKADLIEVLEYSTASAMPVTGESGKIYVTVDSRKLYRWNGTIYQELAALTYTPENLANKQNSLTFDGTGVKYPTVDAVRTHSTDLANPHAVTKSQVGLSNIDNTSDINKPISETAQTALNTKAPITGSNEYIQNRTTQQTATLNISGQGTFGGRVTIPEWYATGNTPFVVASTVENTNTGTSSGSLISLTGQSKNWRLSNSYQTSSGNFSIRDNSRNTNVLDLNATTGNATFSAFVTATKFLSGTSVDNGIDQIQVPNGTISAQPATLSNQVVVKSQLDLKANIASPTFTGVPTAPTAAAGTNTTQIASTAFVLANTNANAVLLTGDQTVLGTKNFYSEETNFGNQIKHHVNNNIANPISWQIKDLIPNQGAFKIGTSTVFLSMRESGPRYISVTDPIESPIATQDNHLVNKGFSDKNRMVSYTVATLPTTPTQGDSYMITDATSPTYLGALTGGGTVKCPVFFNGTIWVSH